MRQSCLLAMQCRVAFRSPPAPPSGRSRRENTGGFPRGKQSARFALPCVPLVVCLNSGSLTACGGCAHRARASLRSPLHPFGESAYQWGRVCACGRTKGLSSGQTIGAARTAVRPACCLPELRVANRLRRLYPLDTRFPSFPPCTPFGESAYQWCRGLRLRAHQRAFLGANNRRGPHCRALRLLFA